MHNRKPRERFLARAGAVVAALSLTVGALAACAPVDSGESADGVWLNVGNGSDNLTQVFNPFLPDPSALNMIGGTKGSFIYEPLVQINMVDIGNNTPWLAKSWEWTNDNKTFTITLQDDVKWSDGEAFSADDVVFTYDLVAKDPALNRSGITFDSVKAVDDSTVEFDFATPSRESFFSLVSLPIVSEHIWSKVEDPATYEDKEPVGTGAFVLDTFSPQSLTLKANTDYWGKKPQIAGLRFIPYKDNTAQLAALVQGDIDWAGTYIPNVEQSYLSKNDHFHYWSPATGIDGLIPNLEVWPLSELPVRQAISLAVDRTQLAASRDSQPASNVIGLPMPAFESVVAPEFKDKDFYQDADEAASILENDGWAKGSDGIWAKDGKKLEFSVSFPSAYTDIAAFAQALVSQLGDFGITMTINGVQPSDINGLTAMGDFDSTLGYPTDSFPDAFSYYNVIMNPAYYVPIGTNNETLRNIQRFNDPKAKELFAAYPLATSDEERTDILNQLQSIWVNQLPIITMFYWGYYANWSDEKVTGFPDEGNAYANPFPNAVTAINLVPVTK
ncbi:ABC transporter substrate-binding protein [Microbacterium sp. NPDC058389]|uniref:ABC transporter substrate-binding protein n=1 Tax=Microbacterium sp. NPDC058389 TaxID=3346475 RepID=UPI0036558504